MGWSERTVRGWVEVRTEEGECDFCEQVGEVGRVVEVEATTDFGGFFSGASQSYEEWSTESVAERVRGCFCEECVSEVVTEYTADEVRRV